MNFLEDIYRLAYIKRYSNVPKLHEESVAEHGFFVAAIVMKLHEEYEFDIGQALQIAISHDMPEIELNDCPHIIKEKYPEIAKAYQVSEEQVAKTLPKIARIGVYWYDAQDSTEAKIVLLADVLQCIQFSSVEIKLGNEDYMKVVYDKSTKRELQIRKELRYARRSRVYIERSQ